jgi:hypothetical protein
MGLQRERVRREVIACFEQFAGAASRTFAPALPGRIEQSRVDASRRLYSTMRRFVTVVLASCCYVMECGGSATQDEPSAGTPFHGVRW